MMAFDTVAARRPVSVGALFDALGSLVGSAALRTDGLPTIDGIVPSVAVQPASSEQAAAVLAACARLGAAVSPVGGGTKLALGNLPEAVDVLLDTSRLNQIIAYTSADLTLAVQAGVTLAAVQARLRAEGQFLPIDPPHAARATIGGLAATNAAGPRRVQAGALRDQIIGMEVAGVDGLVTKSGGMVVKNVTGYHVHKAHIGALGTLGLLVRVNLKVAPLPAAERTLVTGFGDPFSAGQAVGDLVTRPLAATGVDIVERTLAQLPSAPAQPWLLAVRVAGVPAGVDAQLDLVREAVRAAGGSPGEVLDGADQDTLWAAAVAPSEPPSPSDVYVACRFSALSSQVASLLVAAGEAAARAGLGVERAAHAVTGVGRIRLTGTAQPEPYIAAIRELRAAAQRLHAALVVEAAPPAVKRAIDVWGTGPDAATLELMRSLRRAFDAQRSINPGRFIGDRP